MIVYAITFKIVIYNFLWRHISFSILSVVLWRVYHFWLKSKIHSFMVLDMFLYARFFLYCYLYLFSPKDWFWILNTLILDMKSKVLKKHIFTKLCWTIRIFSLQIRIRKNSVDKTYCIDKIIECLKIKLNIRKLKKTTSIIFI